MDLCHLVLPGTVLVQQLMAVLIGRHDVLFPQDEHSPPALELLNNNFEVQQRRQAAVTTTTSTSMTVSQNGENNNTQAVRQCVWEAPDSPSHHQHVDNNGFGGSPRSASPRGNGVIGRFDVTRSPPLTVKKNPAFSKGSGIVTNGSFSSSPSSDPVLEKNQQTLTSGSLPVRRGGKSSGTKMGTGGVGSPGGNVRLGVSGTDTINGRNGHWLANGCVTLRESGRTRDGSCSEQPANQNRLSTYDNVHLNCQNLQNQMANACLNSSCEDKQSVDSATWSTSSCEISLPENSTSCRSSTTTCPEQDFYGGHYEDLEGVSQEGERGVGSNGDVEVRKGNREGSGDGTGGRSSRGTSGSDSSDVFPTGAAPGSHSALHSLVASLKQEMLKQKSEYEARIKR